MKVFIALLTLTLSLNSYGADTGAELNLDLRHISVSGLSSGGYMANQFHIAHSDWVNRAGIIAAGPYYCAQGSIKTALEQCVSKVLSPLSLADLQDQASRYAQEGKIAPLSELQNSRVWLFHGQLDTKVLADISDALYQQYVQWSGADNVRYINDKPYAHLFPTLQNGSDCQQSVSPYLGHCNYDAAGAMLNFLFDNLHSRVDEPQGVLLQLDQQTLGGLNAASLADNAYAYAPPGCLQGESCNLHISFHGCNQNAQSVGTQFAQNSGLNNWADNNHLVVLYPQTKNSTFMPLNPQGCWDWWGYADADYATRKGKQISAVSQMAKALQHYKVQ